MSSITKSIYTSCLTLYILIEFILPNLVFGLTIIKVDKFEFEMGCTSEQFLSKFPEFQITEQMIVTDGSLTLENFFLKNKSEVTIVVTFFYNKLSEIYINDEWWSGIFSDFHPEDYGFTKIGQDTEDINLMYLNVVTEYYVKENIKLDYCEGRFGFLRIIDESQKSNPSNTSKKETISFLNYEFKFGISVNEFLAINQGFAFHQSDDNYINYKVESNIEGEIYLMYAHFKTDIFCGITIHGDYGKLNDEINKLILTGFTLTSKTEEEGDSEYQYENGSLSIILNEHRYVSFQLFDMILAGAK